MVIHVHEGVPLLPIRELDDDGAGTIGSAVRDAVGSLNVVAEDDGPIHELGQGVDHLHDVLVPSLRHSVQLDVAAALVLVQNLHLRLQLVESLLQLHVSFSQLLVRLLHL